MTHEIKIERRWYERLKTGQKSFEIRYNDRDYQVGDILKFLVLKQKVEGENGAFFERMPESFSIKYVLTSDTCPGLHFGWCILALELHSVADDK